MAKTNTEALRDWRAKNHKVNVFEVRGIWAPKENHAEIKSVVKQVMQKMERQNNDSTL